MKAKLITQIGPGTITATVMKDARVRIVANVPCENRVRTAVYTATIPFMRRSYASAVVNGLVDRHCDEGAINPATLEQFRRVVEGVERLTHIETL